MVYVRKYLEEEFPCVSLYLNLYLASAVRHSHREHPKPERPLVWPGLLMLYSSASDPIEINENIDVNATTQKDFKCLTHCFEISD